MKNHADFMYLINMRFIPAMLAALFVLSTTFSSADMDEQWSYIDKTNNGDLMFHDENTITYPTRTNVRLKMKITYKSNPEMSEIIILGEHYCSEKKFRTIEIKTKFLDGRIIVNDKPASYPRYVLPDSIIETSHESVCKNIKNSENKN
ncbi:MAG: hypothetical protein HQL10_10465 [Nitrospirae bacterium]|nr:hypothetical protein [Nitrospirota bacterium]